MVPSFLYNRTESALPGICPKILAGALLCFIEIHFAASDFGLLFVIYPLTHCSRETRKRVIGKQCRPRSDAAECGICSGSPLFANSRGQPEAFREGEILRQFQDFREKFWSNFGFPYTFYTFSLLPHLKIGRSAS